MIKRKKLHLLKKCTLFLPKNRRKTFENMFFAKVIFNKNSYLNQSAFLMSPSVF